MLIYILSALLAANGLLVELNLSQTLSAVVGGTILRYHTSIGLFTFSLGVGSLLFPWIQSFLTNKKILYVSNFFVALLGIVGPQFIIGLDPLSQDGRQIFIVLSYIPTVILGVATGFEIPALFELCREKKNVEKNEQAILSFDYLGMFLASLIFPFLLIGYGVFNLSVITVILSIISFGVIFKLQNEQSEESKKEKIVLSVGSIGVGLICFVIAFCSMSYELILAKLFTDFTSNEVIAHSITIGFYLVGLGLGAYSVERIKSKAWSTLLKTEMILVLTAIFLVPAAYLGFDVWKIRLYNYVGEYSFFLILQSISLWIGFWSGRELPLCLDLMSDKVKSSVPLTLAFNYFGALVAGFVVPLLFLPHWGISGGIFVTGFLNFCIVTYIIFSKGVKKAGSTVLVVSVVLLFLFTKVPQWNRWSEQLFLKTYYQGISIPSLSIESLGNYKRLMDELDDVRRIHTIYQYIDLVRIQLPYSGGAIGTLTLHLNRQPQFSMDTWELYHDSFSYGAINLRGKVPKKILILGGGDGLLAGKLGEISGIESMKMIELDHEMIQFSSSHFEISKANKGILKSEKLNLVIGDAYSWLKSNDEKFDAIFIDFPYPTSFELSRLYSVEFYKQVYQHLNDDGFMVMDAPVSFSLDPSYDSKANTSPILVNSLKSAGFKTLFPFGPVEPFMYVEREERDIQFNYDELTHLENHSFINQTSIKEWYESVEGFEDTVNSIYHPRFLEFGL